MGARCDCHIVMNRDEGDPFNFVYVSVKSSILNSTMDKLEKVDSRSDIHGDTHLRICQNVFFPISQGIEEKHALIHLRCTHKSGTELPLIFYRTNYISVNLFFDVCNF